METEVFEISEQKQQDSFEALLASPKEVNQIAFWYRDALQEMEKRGIEPKDFGSSDLVVAHRNFPGTLSLEGIYVRGSRQVAQQFYQAVNEDPSLVLRLPSLGHSARFLRAAMNPEQQRVIASIKKRLGPGKKGLPDPTESPETQEKVRVFKSLLGLEGTEIEYDLLASMSSSVAEMKQLLTEAVYMYTVLSQARNLIKAVAPSLSDQVDSVFDHTLLFRSPIPEGFRTVFGYGHTGVDGMHGIEYQLDRENLTYSGRKHNSRVLSVAHELTHTVVAELFSFPAKQPGASLRFEKGQATEDEQRLYHFAPKCTLVNVIQEAASEAMEHELTTQLTAKALPPEDRSTLEGIYDYRRMRRQDMSKVNKALKAIEQGRKVPAEVVELVKEKDYVFSYTEGLRLAAALHANGWRINDLPELAERIRGTFSGQKKPPEWVLMSTVFDLGSDSYYQERLAKIKNLKKDAAAE